MESFVMLVAVTVPYADQHKFFGWTHRGLWAGLACLPAASLLIVYVVQSFRLKRLLWVRILLVSSCCLVGFKNFDDISNPKGMSDISKVRK